MRWLKERRRRRIRARPFPPQWDAILRRTVPYTRCLSDDDRRRLRDHIKVFLSEKRFEGAGGMVITDEVRVTIAAQACLLLLHRPSDYYPGLKTIIVYPDRYVAPARRVGPAGVVTESYDLRAGESWHTPGAGGPVVLSWRDVRQGAADARDGQNVVLHEFAHQLDGQSGAVEGVPALEHRSRYVAWARILASEFQRLRRDLATGTPALLRPYAATSPAEFFAVATEMFFERPEALRQHHPALYNELAAFFRQDPASRCPSPAHAPP